MEYPNTPCPVPEPEMFGQALLAAEDVARDIDYCRIDMMLQAD